VGDVEVRKVQSREDVSAKVKAATEKQRAEGLTLERSRDKVDVRELVDRVRQQSLEASRAATTARKQAEKAQADVKATEKRKAEADQAARAARVYAIGEDGEPREYRAKVERDGTRVYLDYGEGQRVRAYQVPPSRARAQARVDRANDAGDEEIRELVDEMRREMREIRELLQQLRRQAQATSNRASARGGATGSGGSGQGSSTARGTWSQGRDGFYGAQGGTSAMGGMRGTSTRSGGASGGGMGGTRAPAANSFERLAPAKTRSSSGAQGGFRSLWSTNDDSSGSTLMR
jgi:hypothetical protein